MLVILDSNILIADFYLKKPNSQLLRKFGRVVLPELCVMKCKISIKND